MSGQTTYRVLAADKLAQEGLDWITQQPDAELVNKPGLSEDELAKIIGDHDAMIVRSGVTVTPAVLANPGRLKVIARAGVGVDNIDLPAATAAGILVVNTAEASTLTTAEHALSLMMALARNIGPASATMRAGGWDRSKYKGVQLAGRTLGVVGFGRIGQAVAARALAMEMDVLAYDPFFAGDSAMDGRVRLYRDFDQMLPKLDIVSFHVPLNDATRGMLGAKQFATAKAGLMVVNAARGGVVDESAIIEALDAGQCGAVALDVYTEEPPPEDSPLRTHPKVLCTPHLGASTVEAQQAVSVDAAAACLAYLRGEGIKGAVNAGGVRVDLDPLQSAYVDLAERMATLISPMVTRGIACVTVELVGSAVAKAAGTVERSALVGLLRGHLDTPMNVINAADVAARRGIKLKCSTVEDAPGSPGAVGPAGGTSGGAGQLSISIEGPAGAVTAATPTADRARRIIGRVYEDHLPRVVQINGYVMDMVPAGQMLLIQNDDTPGMVGLVGQTLGDAGVNIADMTISRRDNEAGGATALMVLKLDAPAPEAVLATLRDQPGVLKVAQVGLADA
jgi:D-3-phosphoglycerate dehydrogenase